MKHLNEISKYKLLKTFVKGEKIEVAIDNVLYEPTFIKVTPTHVTFLTTENVEEQIELEHITKITL